MTTFHTFCMHVVCSRPRSVGVSGKPFKSDWNANVSSTARLEEQKQPARSTSPASFLSFYLSHITSSRARLVSEKLLPQSERLIR